MATEELYLEDNEGAIRTNPVAHPNAAMDTPQRSRLVWKTGLLLAIAVLGNSLGNLALAIGMSHLPPFSIHEIGTLIKDTVLDPYVLLGTALTAIYTLTQLSLFSWADLSFVIPCTASTYVISTLLGRFVLAEHVDLERWIGVVIISVGVALVANTPVETKSVEPQGTTS